MIFLHFNVIYPGISSTADMPLAQLIQALSTQQPGACKILCIKVATMFEFSLSLSVIATSAAFISAGRKQLGHESQSEQHPSSSGEFNSKNRRNTS